MIPLSSDKRDPPAAKGLELASQRCEETASFCKGQRMKKEVQRACCSLQVRGANG
jgi:hypothetical protein